jgi:hypothetical protein
MIHQHHLKNEEFISMASPEKTNITFSVHNKDLEWLDKMAKKLQCSRSAVFAACVDSGRDDWKMLAAVGVKPEHLPYMRDAVKRMKETFRQDIKAMEAAE